MKAAYEASALIQASPQAIWALITDATGLSRWDSGIERVDGRIAPGEKITIYSKINPSRGFPTRVTDFLPGRSMCWSGGMPLGLFKGVRTFTLTQQDARTTRFTMREEFTGLMLPMIWKSMPDLGPSFEQFASGLKREAEAKAAV
jgi:hypothetical protein